MKLKAITGAVLAACMLSTLAMTTASAQERTIVTFKNNVSAADIGDFLADWSRLGVTTVMRVPFINGVVLSLPAGLSAADLSGDPIVASADTDQEVTLQAVRKAKDNSGSSSTWGSNRFIEPTARPGAADRPWGVLHLFDQYYDPSYQTNHLDKKQLSEAIIAALQQAKKIKIAVFDTGIDVKHKKLEKLIEDGADLVGFTPGIPRDNNGHGTHVAGTLIGKEFGIAYGAQLYPVKILNDDATGDVSTLVMALQWAIDHDVDIVNMSVGFRDDNPAVRRAIRKAHEAGIVLVAAVGNHSNWEDDGGSGEGGAGEGGAGEGGAGEGGAGEGGAGEGGATCGQLSAFGEGGAGEGGAGEGGAGEGGAGEGGAGEGGANAGCAASNGYGVMYPAAYPEVIAVAAIDSHGQLARFSNYGPEVDLLAPGVDIVSADINNGFGIANGTSMAAPHVTGAAALVLALAQHQGKTLTPVQVQNILWQTAAADNSIHLVAALEAVMLLR